MPRIDGYSPAQLFFGRRQLTNLPVLQKQYEQCDFSAAKKAKGSSFLKSAEYYDIGKVNLPPFPPGQPVVIQHPKTGKWDSTGIVVGIRPDKNSYTVNCEGRIFIRSRQMLRDRKESEASLTASPEHLTLPSQPSCVNPRTLLPGPPKTLGNHRPTTTGSLTNPPELLSCSSIGPPSAPGCHPSLLSSSTWSSSTFAIEGTREPIRRQGGQSSMSSSCLPQETVPIVARSQRRLPLNTPPRFTRPRPSLTPCTRSSRTPSQVPSYQGLQSSVPPHFQPMGYNSPVSASRASTTPSCRLSPTSETSVGLQESERSDAHLLRRDAVSHTLPVTLPPVSSQSPFFDNQVCPDSHLPGPDTVQPSPLPQRLKKEFPPLGTSGLAQSASIKRNNEQQNNINKKRTKLKFSQSNFVFENISRRSKF